MSPARAANANRVSAAALSLGVLAVANHAVPEAGRADALLYRIVFVLGYGHLLGAALRTGSIRMWRASPWRTGAAVLVLAEAFVLYATAVRAAPAVGLGLLFVSTWHSIENDRGLSGLYARGHISRFSPDRAGLAIDGAWFAAALVAFQAAGAVEALGVASWPGSAAPAWWFQGIGIACVALARCSGASTCSAATALVVLCWAEAIGSRFRFAEAFAMVTLYHVFSWALVSAERSWRRGGWHGLALRVGIPHGLPVLLVGALGSVDALRGWHAVVLAPPIYLFWSSLHVFHTLWSRRTRH